ncbi:adenosylmethionine decarboxylase [Rivibacter subsaxonicus]|uniref:Spermidine synthase/S-adenosylmethionine decarboxylase n=1 Tax=Rivibacter subsaxonicus TaxID=457575 RepID=A0A4Q7VVC2_9BURK|nr:adenosylmethionine decarboxylase [Rivibacter subsaxonicus]RZU00614.1 spermidine synthase/S-adenosylmethionine decarboxylase [Rivibacter subsaxonicus]
MQGLHLTADLAGCPRGSDLALPMFDPAALRALCVAAVDRSGLRMVGERFHGFAPEHGEPRGVTGVLLLAESHLAVHTWPEIGRVTLDVFVCQRHGDHAAAAHGLLEELIAAFAPERVERHALQRGATLAVEHSA